MLKVEVYINSLEELKLIENYPFIKRVVLNAGTDFGNTTPNMKEISNCTTYLKNNNSKIEFAVSVKPKANNYTYSFLEKIKISNTIGYCLKSGVDTIVFGMLNKNDVIDAGFLRSVDMAKKHMKATFSNALEESVDLLGDIDWLISEGINNVRFSAYDITTLKKLQQNLQTTSIELIVGEINSFDEITKIKEEVNPNWISVDKLIRDEQNVLNEEKIAWLQSVI